MQKVCKRLAESYTRVRIRLADTHQRQKSEAQEEQGESFAVGDRIWLFVPVMKKGTTKKLASLWRGPHTVIDKTSLVN